LTSWEEGRVGTRITRPRTLRKSAF